MIKRVSLFSLPPGADGDEFWEYWKNTHAADVKRLAGDRIKKYIINRVTTEHEKELKFWGLIETWWESAEDYQELFSSPDAKDVYKDFWERTISGGSVFMEELEIPV